MNINGAANHHFNLSVPGNKARTELKEPIKSGGQSVTLCIKDTLELSGQKIPGYYQDGKYYLEVSEELKSRTLLEADTSQMIIGDLPWQMEPRENVFEKYGDSNLLNISSASQRAGYYSRLFFASADAVNEAFGQSGGLDRWNAYTVELSVARYEELREQVIKAFENDKELLEKNLESLDWAFAFNLERVARSNARHLESESMTANWAKNTGNEPKWELNKLGAHKSFNMNRFQSNAINLMRQFAQEYIQQIKDGASYASAWGNAVEIMTRTTETASVNNLSFSDFMILDNTPWGNATTIAGNIAARNNHSFSFNNNPNLSEELRMLLK